MLEAEREAASHAWRNPGLLVGGVLAATAVVGAAIVGWSLVEGLRYPRWIVFLLAISVASVVRVFVLPFPLAGLYAGVRLARSETGGGASVTTVLGGAVRNYRRLLGATVVTRLVALALAVPVFGLLLVGDTLLTYVRYARGGDQLAILLGNEQTVILMVLLAGALARFALVFYDLPVLFGGVAPSRGWRTGLRFVRRRPRALLRYGVGRALLWSPVVGIVFVGHPSVEWVTGTQPAARPMDGLAVLWVTIGAAVVALTLIPVYHAVAYERTVEPFLREPTSTESKATTGPASVATAPIPDEQDGSSIGRRGIAALVLATLLLGAAVAGAAAVRVNEVRPMPDDEVRPVEPSMDAETIVENARFTAASTSHREIVHIQQRNLETGELIDEQVTTIAFDRENRRYLMKHDGSPNVEDSLIHSTYGSTSTLATEFDGIVGGPIGGLYERGFERNGWFQVTWPGYTRMLWYLESNYFVIPRHDDWRIVDRTDETVVVGFEDSQEHTGEGEAKRLTERHVRVHVDRTTGRPSKVVDQYTVTKYDENGTIDHRRQQRFVTEFRDYGDTDVERPGDLGDKGLVERLADLVFY